LIESNGLEIREHIVETAGQQIIPPRWKTANEETEDGELAHLLLEIRLEHSQLVEVGEDRWASHRPDPHACARKSPPRGSGPGNDKHKTRIPTRTTPRTPTGDQALLKRSAAWPMASTMMSAIRLGTWFGRKNTAPGIVTRRAFGHAISTRRSSTLSLPSPFSA